MADDLVEIAAILSENPDATFASGQALAGHLAAGDMLALKGDLGAGKSNFARRLIVEALASNGITTEDILNPTFTMVQTSPFARAADKTRAHSHLDCWRLGSPEEIHELGFDEIQGKHIALIEWPEKISDYIPPHALIISIEEDPTSSDKRRISFHTSANAAAGWREKVSAAGLL